MPKPRTRKGKPGRPVRRRPGSQPGQAAIVTPLDLLHVVLVPVEPRESFLVRQVEQIIYARRGEAEYQIRGTFRFRAQRGKVYGHVLLIADPLTLTDLQDAKDAYEALNEHLTGHGFEVSADFGGPEVTISIQPPAGSSRLELCPAA